MAETKKTTVAAEATQTKKTTARTTTAKAEAVKTVKAPKKQAAPYTSKGTVTVTLTKSLNGRLIKQKKTAEALGLSKIGDSKTHKDNPAIRGMIFVVKHLVDVK